MKTRKHLWAPILTALAGVALLIPAASQGATVVNGDFETGSLSGWVVHNSATKGNWYAYTGDKTPVEKEEEERPEELEIIPIEPVKPLTRKVEPLLSPVFPPFFAPPQGSWAAVSDESAPDIAILYQDIALEPYWSHQLTMTFYYHSFAPIFVPNPDTLALPPWKESISKKNRNRETNRSEST